MKNIRVIARLDIKAPNLIKGINLEGVRVVGNPAEYAKKYYEQGIDEILYMDVVATLYGRHSLVDIIKETAEDVFVPMAVGGGIRTLEDANQVLRAGADKVAINTAAIHNPSVITEIARRFGSQCMVLSIEAKRVGPRKWEAYTDHGREKTGLDVMEWAIQATELGVGEVLLTSVDQEGTCKGFDIELIQAVTQVVSVPVIASGGMGSYADALKAIQEGGADGIAIAHVLHYDKIELFQLKKLIADHHYNIRTIC